MDLLGIGIVIPLVLAGILVSVTYSLLNQSSRQVFAVIRRLDELESAIDGLVDAMPGAGSTHAEGIPIGEPAPDFSLPALTGSAPTVSLEDLRGKRLLLMFMRPGCTYCQQMAPDVAEMPIDGRGGRPVPVILTIGEEAENREFVDEFDLKGPVLRHADDALYRPYKITGTPMGYLIDEQGNIASDVLVGGDAILATYESTIVPENGSAQTENGTNGAGLKTTQSRLQRDGLKAGTVAPDFSLPAIDGSTLHLADLRGRPVLLVFSDPECAPCQALAPHLEKLHR
ncbi:MAG TPA: TlpA disulfide reductase family protein, partial [Chloroflexota bacterium]|nr:TlpA disulfide reductase family protein [Chloroflexota bacterium]